MKNILLLCVIFISIISCNQEKFLLEGDILDFPDANLEVKMIPVSGDNCRSIKSIQIENGRIEEKIEGINPPVKLSFFKDSIKVFDIWIEKFGKTAFKATYNEKVKMLWVDNFMSKELKRIKRSYYEKYIENVESKIKVADSLNRVLVETERLADDELQHLDSIERDIKKAKKLYKKNVLATFRASKLNYIAQALMFEEWDKMTSWQKEEVHKSAFKSIPSSGLYWQLKN